MGGRKVSCKLEMPGDYGSLHTTRDRPTGQFEKAKQVTDLNEGREPHDVARPSFVCRKPANLVAP